MKHWMFLLSLLACTVSQGTELVFGQVVLSKLNLSEVSFVIMTNEKFHKKLEDQALMQFQKAGLALKGQGYPRLVLTLRPQNSEFSRDVDIYERKLELQEEVPLPRSGHKRVVTTWFYGNDPAIERKKITLYELQSDLDKMLMVFIDQWKFLNPEQKQGKP